MRIAVAEYEVSLTRRLDCVGTFKEEDGAGLGDGDTTNANDVSNQIENEDQIMGAQQKQPRDDDGCASAKQDDSKGDDDDEEHQGIEMQHDFDGIFDDVPEEAGNTASDEVWRLFFYSIANLHHVLRR